MPDLEAYMQEQYKHIFLNYMTDVSIAKNIRKSCVAIVLNEYFEI